MIEVVKKPIFRISERTQLELGDIVKLIVEGSEVVLTRSEGDSAFGFITKIHIDERGYSHARVKTGSFIANTINYETEFAYPLNANLFVSPKGKLTTAYGVNKASQARGMVLRPPSATDVRLQFLWY